MGVGVSEKRCSGGSVDSKCGDAIGGSDGTVGQLEGGAEDKDRVCKMGGSGTGVNGPSSQQLAPCRLGPLQDADAAALTSAKRLYEQNPAQDVNCLRMLTGTVPTLGVSAGIMRED